MSKIKKSYKIEKIRKSVYALHFSNHYDLCMHFLRFQEFYESEKFANTSFTIIELMEWYSKKYGSGMFTYPLDWAGFNIHSSKIKEAFDLIPDWNKYDFEMLDIVNLLSKKEEQFYLIGYSCNNKSVLEHEIAHSFFALNKSYKDEMIEAIHSLPEDVLTSIKEKLQALGYSNEVLLDEIQAYLSCGYKDILDIKHRKFSIFKKIFKKYSQLPLPKGKGL